MVLGRAVSLPLSPIGKGESPAEALAQEGGSETDAAFGEASRSTCGTGGGVLCLGLAFAGKAVAPARGVLELTPAEAPPAAAVEELAPAEALLCPPTRAAISLASSHLPGQAASGFCQSGAKRGRP